jgi:hypothetical protein
MPETSSLFFIPSGSTNDPFQPRGLTAIHRVRDTPRLPAIINLINQLVEPVIEPMPTTHSYPQLQVTPKADCKRYEMLYATQRDAA